MESFALGSFAVLSVLRQSTGLGMSQAYVQVKSHTGKGPELMKDFRLLKTSCKN